MELWDPIIPLKTRGQKVKYEYLILETDQQRRLKIQSALIVKEDFQDQKKEEMMIFQPQSVLNTKLVSQQVKLEQEISDDISLDNSEEYPSEDQVLYHEIDPESQIFTQIRAPLRSQ